MKLKTTKPLLEFSAHTKELTEGLSAALLIGEDLWLACDELTSVERLTLSGDGLTFSGHRSFELHGPPPDGPLELPASGKKKPDGEEPDREIDIEGLDFEGGYLWLVGSHSIKREKVAGKKDRKAPDAENIGKLSKTDAFGNRFLLARVPLVRDEKTGQSVLAPPSPEGKLKAAQLPCTMTDSALTRAILKADAGAGPDRHLAPWLALPGKDNGFDIEGLAVSGGRVFLGLRGPVLRGWAVVLELHVEDGEGRELRLKQLDPEGRPYRKHFLNLGGLGVRDLCVDGPDLLVLAGPSMTHDGPVQVFRWRGGAAQEGAALVWPEEFAGAALPVEHGVGVDRAEGMALVPGADRPSILVVYDSPSAERMPSKRAVYADVFELP